MNANYDDILSKISEDPQWFDEAAVPRFCAFEPGRAANIYASEIALVEIACQNCSHKFLVAMTTGILGESKVSDLIRTKTLHYGDPPNINCCAAGPTMNSEPLRVVEFWARNHQEYVENGIIKNMDYFTWRRCPELEISLEQ